MEITTLIDSRRAVGASTLRTEPGMSLHLVFQGRSILFDTGLSGAFLDNANTLGISISDVQALVLSHAHFDHTGGLPRFIAVNTSAPIYASASLATPVRLRLFGGVRKDIGVQPRVIAAHADRFRLYAGWAQPEPRLTLLVTSVAGTHPQPRGNRLLYQNAASGGLRRDDFRHELVTVVDDNGLVVFTGCGHHGVLNIVDMVRAAFPDTPIKALVGGFHLVGLPVLNLYGDRSANIRQLGYALARCDIPRIITGHCTGWRGYQKLRHILGDRIEYAAAGSRFTV